VFQFQNDDLTKMGGVAKILERMVTQNMFDGIAKGMLKTTA